MRSSNNLGEHSGSRFRRSRRRMCQANSPSSIRPAAIDTHTVTQSCTLVRNTPSTTRNSPAPDNTAPTRSNSRRGAAVTGSPRASTTTTATTSTCNRNDARQLNALVISPPTNGPAAAPSPPAPLTIPNPRALAVPVVIAVTRM